MSHSSYRSRYLLFAVLPLALAACMHGGGTGAATTTQPSAMAGPMTDAQIAGVVDAVNLGEVQQAHMAQERASKDEVRMFANHMMTGHQAAARQQAQVLDRAGIMPEETDLSRQLRNQGQQTEQQLSGLRGDQFDRAYIDSQVRQHRAALQLLDEKLIPSAQDPAYRAYLERVRSEVAQHLATAEQIEARTVG